MKVKKQPKKAVQACEIAPHTTVVGDLVEVSNQQNSADPRTTAISCIEGAISALTAIAQNDPVVKDSIANLAVVMMDLKC